MNSERIVSVRAILVGTLVAVIAAFITPYTAYYTRTWHYGWGTLPNGPVVFAFLLVVVNGLLVRFWPSKALTRADVLVIYSILAISTALIVVHVPYTMGLAAYPFYRARVQLGWAQDILPYLPTWLHPDSIDVTTWFWEGLPAGQAFPWGEWIAPFIGWGSFTLALLAAMMCLSAIVSKDWVERQKLTFPLNEVPLAMVGEEGKPTIAVSSFRINTFWLGYIPTSLMILLIWLNGIYPAIPAPARDHAIGQNFTGLGLPWSTLTDLMIRIAPATIGVMALVPSEISFSVWAFYLIFRVYLIVCGGFGIPPYGTAGSGFNPRFFWDYAGNGGFVVISAIVLWRSRDVVMLGLRQLFGKRPRESSDSWVPMSYAAAVVGLLLSNLFMYWWARRAGMSGWSFALIMAAFYVAIIGTTRLTAAAGLLQHRPPTGSRWMVLRLLGSRALDQHSLTLYSYLNMGYMLEPQNFASNYMTNSFQLFHRSRINARNFTLGLTIAMVGVLLAASVGVLYPAYRHGAVSMLCWPVTAVPTCAFLELSTSIQQPEQPDNWLRLAMVAGGGMTLLLSWLSANFVWWQFSPIGFVIASVMHTNRDIWANALLGWLFATSARRFGGLRLYRSLRPAFVGLILGHFLTDAAMAAFATIFLGASGITSLVP